MYCIKCGKKGFPVRLACMNCDADLPGVPPAFEHPDVKSSAPPVTCSKCHRPATDARVACLACNHSFPRPFAFPADDLNLLANDPEIERFVFICLKGACEECRRWDGFEFKPEELSKYRVPIQTCKHAVCWCGIVGIYRDEGVVILE
jgi:hypothetical protein